VTQTPRGTVIFSPTFTRTPLPPALTPSPPSSPTSDLWVETTLASLTLEQKIGQLLLISVSGQELTEYTCQLIQQLNPGGIVYLGSNILTPEQTQMFSAGLQACAGQSAPGLPLLLALDHEGQYVTRFDSGATIFPPALALGATGNPDFAYQAALAGGRELAYSGVNMVLGPVADVLTDYDNTVISQRAYGGDPQQGALFVAQAVRGYLDAGIIPVLKHFPGHGGVAGDSHLTLPVDEASWETLLATYLPPFASGIQAGAPAIMSSHVAFPALDERGRPTTLSHPTLSILPDTLGFSGVLVSDAMGMGAITNGGGWSVSEASFLAVKSGIDLLLITSAEQAYETKARLLEAVEAGELSLARVDEAVRHVLTLKAAFGLAAFPLAEAPTPDWAADVSLAREMGARAVTLFRNQNNLIPLPTVSQNILIIGPPDGWGLYPLLTNALTEAGHRYYRVEYSGPWNGPIPERGNLDWIPGLAVNYDLVLMLTWDAHVTSLTFDDTWQIELVNRLLAGPKPLIVVALKSPVDLLDFPNAPTYLATFGTTRGQLQGMVEGLVGKAQVAGQNPLPGLP
jgi:beta-N-acetylhexosaminidase